MIDRDRTLWCDLSNYESLDEVSSDVVDLSSIVNLYLNDSCLINLKAGKDRDIRECSRQNLSNRFEIWRNCQRDETKILVRNYIVISVKFVS